MTELSSIQSLHWQPKLGHTDIVENINDIDQCIRIILGTPQGSDPHRPEFGCGIYKYIDMPIDQARPYIVREVVDAIRLWEPRCVLEKVVVDIDEAHMSAVITWRLTDDIEQIIRQTRVKL